MVFSIIVNFYSDYFSLSSFHKSFYGKVSKFSIDAILVFLFTKFGTKKARQQAYAFTKNVDRIMLFGVYAFLSFIGAVYGIIVWLQRIAK